MHVHIRGIMMEVQQQHSPVGVGPLDFSRRAVTESSNSAFRVVKPKQLSSTLMIHRQSLPPEANNNESFQEQSQIAVESDGNFEFIINSAQKLNWVKRCFCE